MKFADIWSWCGIFGLFGACTSTNPTYCDENTSCNKGFHCYLEQKRCISDEAPLDVVSTDPTRNATDVLTTTPIVITFSEPIDAAALKRDAFVLSPAEAGDFVNGTLAVDKNRLTFRPGQLLAAGTIYTAKLDESIQGEAGNLLARKISWGFKTARGPVVTQTEPADAEVGVPARAMIRVLLSETIDPKTVTPESFAITSDDMPIEGQREVNDKELHFTPAKPLLPNRRYAVTLTASLRDQQGYKL